MVYFIVSLTIESYFIEEFNKLFGKLLFLTQEWVEELAELTSKYNESNEANMPLDEEIQKLDMNYEETLELLKENCQEYLSNFKNPFIKLHERVNHEVHNSLKL